MCHFFREGTNLVPKFKVSTIFVQSGMTSQRCSTFSTQGGFSDDQQMSVQAVMEALLVNPMTEGAGVENDPNVESMENTVGQTDGRLPILPVGIPAVSSQSSVVLAECSAVLQPSEGTKTSVDDIEQALLDQIDDNEQVLPGNTDTSQPMLLGHTDNSDPSLPRNTDTSQPMLLGHTDNSDPSLPINTDTSQPVLLGQTDSSDPSLPRNTDTSEPVLLGHTDNSDPSLPRNTDTSQPVLLGHTDNSEPILPRNTDTSQPVLLGHTDSSESVLPGNTDNKEPMLLGHTDNSDHVLQGNTDNKEPMLLCHTDNSDQVLQGNTDNKEPMLLCHTDNSDQVLQGNTDNKEHMLLDHTDNSERVLPSPIGNSSTKKTMGRSKGIVTPHSNINLPAVVKNTSSELHRQDESVSQHASTVLQALSDGQAEIVPTGDAPSDEMQVSTPDGSNNITALLSADGRSLIIIRTDNIETSDNGQSVIFMTPHGEQQNPTQTLHPEINVQNLENHGNTLALLDTLTEIPNDGNHSNKNLFNQILSDQDNGDPTKEDTNSVLHHVIPETAGLQFVIYPPEVKKTSEISGDSGENKGFEQKASSSKNIKPSETKDKRKLKNSASEEQRMKCDLCSATFTRIGNLTRHRMIHTVSNTKEDYRYKCSECGRLFLQRCDRQRHMLIHSGKEPHRCKQCGKGYIRRSDLVVHERFHNKERTFFCAVCGKSFCQNGDLRRHVRLVHEKQSKMMTCGHCKKKYSKEATLIRHMQMVHRDIIIQSLSGWTDDGSTESRVAPAMTVMEMDQTKVIGSTQQEQIQTKKSIIPQ